MSTSESTANHLVQTTKYFGRTPHDAVPVALRRENELQRINTLPEELFLHIFGFLPVSALLAASRVCSLWRDSLLGSACLWTELGIDYGEWTDGHEAATTVQPCAVTCIQLDPITGQCVYARMQYYSVYRIAGRRATDHAETHVPVWLTSMLLRHLETRLVAVGVEAIRTSHTLLTVAPQLVFLSLELWDIPDLTIELPGVRYLQVCSKSARSGNEPDLARIARMFPNLHRLALGLPQMRPCVSHFDKIEPRFEHLSITALELSYEFATVGIDLALVPHIDIICRYSKNMDVSRLLAQTFPRVMEIHVIGAHRTIKGRTEDDRTFAWTNIIYWADYVHKEPYRFDSDTVANLLVRFFPADSIVRMEVMDYHVRGTTADGREFLWTQLAQSEFSLFVPLFTGVTVLIMDVIRLSNLREDMTMPNLVSLTVEIGEMVPSSVAKMLFGGAGRRFRWPTPELKELIMKLKITAGQQSEIDVEVWRTIKNSQLEHFVHEYLSVPPLGLTTLRLDGIVLIKTSDQVSSLASIVQSTSEATAHRALGAEPLVRQFDPVYDRYAHFVDVTPFYQYCRSANEEDLTMLESLVHYDSDDSDYEPDPDVDTLMSSDSESDYESDNDDWLSESEGSGEDGDEDDEGHAEQAPGPFSNFEVEEKESSDNHSEVDLALEIKEIKQHAEARLREGERNLHRFLPEEALRSTRPFVPTFAGRQFKQLILQAV